jgi:hypothetical protein
MNRVTVKVILSTLIVGLVTAILFGGFFAVLQYREVATAFPPERVQLEFESRLARIMFRSPLLFMMQIGVSTGVLAWQVQRFRLSMWRGALCGGIVGVVLVAAAGIMQTQPPLLVVGLLMHVGAGMLGTVRLINSLQDSSGSL